jgi:hypothetical protein
MAKVVRREIEWELFWTREVLILGLPFLIAVFRLPKAETIIGARLEELLATLFFLTLGNILWSLIDPSIVTRPLGKLSSSSIPLRDRASSVKADDAYS